MMPRALRKLACDRCYVEEIRTHDGTVVRRLRIACPAHRSRR